MYFLRQNERCPHIDRRQGSYPEPSPFAQDAIVKVCTCRFRFTPGSILVFLAAAALSFAGTPAVSLSPESSINDLDEAALVAVTQDESLLYLVGDDATLVILDYQQTPPAVLSTFTFAHQPDQILLQQHLLAAAEGEFGVELIDVSEPSSPQSIGMIDSVEGYPNFEAEGVCFMSPVRMLVASGDNVHLFDLTNLGEIVHLGVHQGERTARDLSVAGTLLAVGNRGFGFETVDLTDPGSPQHIAQSGDRADQVTLLGTHAYTAAEEFEAAVMRVIDVDPELEEPAVLGADETYAGYDGEFTIPELVVNAEGTVAAFPFMWEHGDGSVGYGVFIYNTSDPEAPDKVAQINLPAEPTGASMNGNHFAVTYGNRVALFDLTNPANPVELMGYSTDVSEFDSAVTLPRSPEIEAVYPNPFNATTRVVFLLPSRQPIKLALFDLLGRQQVVLAEGIFAPGRHHITLKMDHFASGTYLVRLQGEQMQSTRKLVLVK